MADTDRNAADSKGTAPSQDEIRTALEKILASPDFTSSDQRRNFLRFVVEESLAGREQGLKGVVIAHEVFRRDASFDSKSDPVVRLEARRLRRDLDSYYVGPGSAEPVRISIPKGGYVPRFETLQAGPARPETPDLPAPEIEPPEPREMPRGFRRTPAIAALLVVPTLIVLGLFWLLWPDDAVTADSATVDLPRVAILPFEALDPSPTTHALASGLETELVHYLSQFRGLRLFVSPSWSETTGTSQTPGEVHLPSYVVRGEVLTEGQRASVLVQLLKAGSGEVVWNDTYDLQMSPGSLIDLRDSVSAEIAGALGQPYGPLAEDIRYGMDSPPPASLESYLCVLRAYAYRRTFEQDAFEQVRDCLEAAVSQNPGFDDAWAMLGWVRLDAARYRFVPPEQIDTEYVEALSAAERAYSLDPNNVLALKALSAIHHHLGNYDEAEAFGWRALELNPNDPDTLAQIGWRLAVRGKFDAGVPLMERSIERTVDPPAWYFHLLSIYHLVEDDPQQALEFGEIAAAKGSSFGNFLVAAAAGALGDTAKARTALEGVAAAPALAADPAAFMRLHGATDEIVGEMMSGYTEAQRLVSGGDDRDAVPTR